MFVVRVQTEVVTHVLEAVQFFESESGDVRQFHVKNAVLIIGGEDEVTIRITNGSFVGLSEPRYLGSPKSTQFQTRFIVLHIPREIHADFRFCADIQAAQLSRVRKLVRGSSTIRRWRLDHDSGT